MSARLQSRAAFYLLFTASGFAGLIYESIWTHYLKRFLGHAAYAPSLVLIVSWVALRVTYSSVRASACAAELRQFAKR